MIEMPDPLLALARELRSEIATLRADNTRLRAALCAVRAAFSNENGLNALSIVDTVWVSEIETALDCIDAALEIGQ